MYSVKLSIKVVYKHSASVFGHFSLLNYDEFIHEECLYQRQGVCMATSPI